MTEVPEQPAAQSAPAVTMREIREALGHNVGPKPAPYAYTDTTDLSGTQLHISRVETDDHDGTFPVVSIAIEHEDGRHAALYIRLDDLGEVIAALRSAGATR